MTSELFAGLLVFATISAWTPGPSNALLLASGLAHGFRKSVPIVLGVALGFPIMVALVGFGLGRLFEAAPLLYAGLKYAGAAYMLWLAWKIATASPSTGEATSDSRPMTFLQAAAFQWINPKGWVTALTALTAYTLPAHYSFGVVVVEDCGHLSTIEQPEAVTRARESATWAYFASTMRRTGAASSSQRSRCPRRPGIGEPFISASIAPHCE